MRSLALGDSRLEGRAVMRQRCGNPDLVRVPVAEAQEKTYRVAGLFGVGKSELAMIFLAPALGFPELFTLLIVTQVKHLLDIFLIFHLGEGWR